DDEQNRRADFHAERRAGGCLRTDGRVHAADDFPEVEIEIRKADDRADEIFRLAQAAQAEEHAVCERARDEVAERVHAWHRLPACGDRGHPARRSSRTKLCAHFTPGRMPGLPTDKMSVPHNPGAFIFPRPRRPGGWRCPPAPMSCR